MGLLNAVKLWNQVILKWPGNAYKDESMIGKYIKFWTQRQKSFISNKNFDTVVCWYFCKIQLYEGN